MRRRLSGSLVCALSLLVGCGGSKSESASEAPTPKRIAAADATTAELIASVGDGAAAVFVFRDEGWAELGTTFAQSFGRDVGGALGRLSRARDPVAGVWALTQMMQLGLPEPRLEGRDPSRPMVVSAFESPYDGPPGAAIAMIANTDDRHPPSRYQLIIPASDVSVLTASLSAWISAGGTAVPELVSGRADAVGLRLGELSTTASHVAILPGRGNVRVVLLHNSHGLDASAVRPWLDITPVSAPDTPAHRHVADTRPLAVLVRPWRLRAFGAWQGLEQAQLAIETVSLEQRNAARTRGTAIASTIALLAPDENAEFDDWAFAVAENDGRLSLTAVASLTDQGQRIWKAGTKAQERPFALKRDVKADVFVRGDVAAMLNAAGKHDVPGRSLGDLFRTVQMCGALCPVFFAMRWPVAALKSISGAEPPVRAATEAALLGAHLAWVEDGSSGPVWAAALIGTGKEVAALVPLLQAVTGRTKLPTHEMKRGGRTVVLVGAGVDPTTVFDTDTAGPQSADVVRIGATANTLGLPTELAGRLNMAGTALTAEVVLGPGEPGFAPEVGGLRWPSPMRAAPQSEAADCLQAAAGVVLHQLNAAVMGSGADAPKRYTEAVDAAATPLRCAAKDPQLAPAALRLGDTIAIIAARGHLARTEVASARAILANQCKVTGGTGRACEAATGLGDVGTPKLSSDSGAERCNPDYAWSRGAPLVVDGAEVLFEERRAPATPEAVAAVLVEALSMESRYKKSAPQVSLAVSADTPFGEVLPVLFGVAAVGGRPNPLVRGAGGELISIPVEVDLPATLPVDWKLREGYRPLFDVEEEPPPPETPSKRVIPDEGKMGKPTATSKTGLYAMKRPKEATDGGEKDAAVLAVQLTRADLVVVLPDGKRIVVGDPADIRDMADQLRDGLGFGRRLAVTLSVEPDVPWSRYVELMVDTCRTPLVLVAP